VDSQVDLPVPRVPEQKETTGLHLQESPWRLHICFLFGIDWEIMAERLAHMGTRKNVLEIPKIFQTNHQTASTRTQH
jgi:hypothetical protein